VPQDPPVKPVESPVSTPVPVNPRPPVTPPSPPQSTSPPTKPTNPISDKPALDLIEVSDQPVELAGARRCGEMRDSWANGSLKGGNLVSPPEGNALDRAAMPCAAREYALTLFADRRILNHAFIVGLLAGERRFQSGCGITTTDWRCSTAKDLTRTTVSHIFFCAERIPSVFDWPIVVHKDRSGDRAGQRLGGRAARAICADSLRVAALRSGRSASLSDAG